MIKKAEKYKRLVGWLGKVNGVMETEQGKVIVEFVCTFELDYGAEVAWRGSRALRSKLESCQVRMGKKLAGSSRTVAGCAVMRRAGVEDSVRET